MASKGKKRVGIAKKAGGLEKPARLSSRLLLQRYDIRASSFQWPWLFLNKIKP